MKLKKLIGLMAVAGFALPGAAMATNGYFSHGYGMKAKGMGGAATAMADDAFGGANNPASMVFAGDRLDLGIDLFSPKREASRSGSMPTLNGTTDSDSNYFGIPEFGYNKMLNNNLSLGVSVYGNGGMNTDYPAGQYNCGAGAANMMCGNTSLGVDLMQLMIAPTVAFKIAPNHSIGISPLIGYQRFKAEGLQAFTPNSSSPNNLTNKGYDDSFGYGVRIGYMGKITPAFTIGAAYATKMDMQKFDKYKGLFAEQGAFDIPENYNVGIAYQVTPELTLALDYQRINYSGVKSISNPSTNQALLGSSGGPGFGWQDIDVWKLGAAYQYNQHWTLRAGYNHGDNPIQARDVTFNILAPGVVKDHATLGVTYLTNTGNELTVSYMHAFENSVSGASPSFGGTETIKMYQNSLGVAYAWKM
ncbi:MAG TPA: outer membrane protein transport protein [Sulfuriferula sp.]|nr:outer membrane protein transport protein [Sulfuriferula sp.]